VYNLNLKRYLFLFKFLVSFNIINENNTALYYRHASCVYKYKYNETKKNGMKYFSNLNFIFIYLSKKFKQIIKL